MKLVFYFGLMFVSLVVSLLLGISSLKRYLNIWKSFTISTIGNIIILGAGSLWWVLTERDGISQGLGVIYYLIAMAVITVVNLLVIYVYKSRHSK